MEVQDVSPCVGFQKGANEGVRLMAKTGTQFDELLYLKGLRSSNRFLFVQKVLKYKLLQTCKQNKLGQRQSQTPVSSAF